jgi:hypothetical protein
VDLLTVDAGSALCLAAVMSLGLHEIAIAIHAYKQNGYENFYHDTVPYVCIIAQPELMVKSQCVRAMIQPICEFITVEERIRVRDGDFEICVMDVVVREVVV